MQMTNWPLLETIWFPKTPKKYEYIRTRLQSWFKEKHSKQINLDVVSKQEASQTLFPRNKAGDKRKQRQRI